MPLKLNCVKSGQILHLNDIYPCFKLIFQRTKRAEEKRFSVLSASAWLFFWLHRQIKALLTIHLLQLIQAWHLRFSVPTPCILQPIVLLYVVQLHLSEELSLLALATYSPIMLGWFSFSYITVVMRPQAVCLLSLRFCANIIWRKLVA